MKRVVTLALGLVLMVGHTSTLAGEGKTTWIQVRKPMDKSPAGVLAKTVVSGSLLKAGFKLQPPDRAPKTKAGTLVPPDVFVKIELNRNRGDAGQSSYSLAIRAMGPDGRMLAAVAEQSAKYQEGDQQAGLNVLGAALEGASKKMLKMLGENQKQRAEHGNRYSLSFSNLPQRGVMKINVMLKQLCERVKLRGMGGGSARFSATCRQDLATIRRGLEEGFAEKFGGEPARFESQGGHTLVVTFP